MGVARCRLSSHSLCVPLVKDHDIVHVCWNERDRCDLACYDLELHQPWRRCDLYSCERPVRSKDFACGRLSAFTYWLIRTMTMGCKAALDCSFLFCWWCFLLLVRQPLSWSGKSGWRQDDGTLVTFRIMCSGRVTELSTLRRVYESSKLTRAWQFSMKGALILLFPL